MGLNKEPFVVSDTVSVLDPYSNISEGIINLFSNGDSEIVATVDVCVTQPQKTQVSLDSMVQIAVSESVVGVTSVTFEVTYELMCNGTTIATINDEMDYAKPADVNFRHTNFPNFSVVDNNTSVGINTYDFRVTRVSTTPTTQIIRIASRSLKATVFTS